MSASDTDRRRLYSDLSWLFPIITPPEDYLEEGEFYARAIKAHSPLPVESLLDLGCGGGHNDFGLKRWFRITGVDASQDMLALASHLNPEATYHQGDMRTVRLGTTFDCVAVFDAIGYMTTVEDLRAALTTAYLHLRPGGALLTIVENTPEAFEQNGTECNTNRKGDVEVTLVENQYDPDPMDTTFELTQIYLIRERGKLRVEVDRHLMGIFPLITWLGILGSLGLETEVLAYPTLDPRERETTVLICRRPS